MARNITYDQMLARQEELKAAAIAAVPEYETTTASIPKKDKSGKVVTDDDGFPVLVEKRMLKRAIVAAEWDDRLKPFIERAHDRY
jgi:hypothetical protein